MGIFDSKSRQREGEMANTEERNRGLDVSQMNPSELMTTRTCCVMYRFELHRYIVALPSPVPMDAKRTFPRGGIAREKGVFRSKLRSYFSGD